VDGDPRLIYEENSTLLSFVLEDVKAIDELDQLVVQLHETRLHDTHEATLIQSFGKLEGGPGHNTLSIVLYHEGSSTFGFTAIECAICESEEAIPAFHHRAIQSGDFYEGGPIFGKF
jgi:hypothetical protein